MKESCGNCFKLLGTPQRFKIFFHLKKNDKNSKGVNIKALVKLTSLRQPTVTFHINRLVKKGIVSKQRVGREVYCRVKKVCANCPLFD